MRQAGMLAAVALLGLAGAGCGDNSGLATVTGSVTLNGEPVARGKIDFLPEDGATATGGGLIKDGQFSARVPPGPKKVSISASKAGAQRPMYDNPSGGMVTTAEEMIPDRYNKETELTLEVKPGQNPPVEYKLTSP